MDKAFRIALSEFDEFRKCTSFCAYLASGNVPRELRIKLVVKPVLDDTNAIKGNKLTLYATQRYGLLKGSQNCFGNVRNEFAP